MNALQAWAARSLWFMFGVSACWVLYVFASHYESCRVDGTNKFGCLLLALFAGWFEVVVFAVVTTIQLLKFVLP
jgi:hypothetical protein